MISPEDAATLLGMTEEYAQASVSAALNNGLRFRAHQHKVAKNLREFVESVTNAGTHVIIPLNEEQARAMIAVGCEFLKQTPNPRVN